MFTSNRNPVTKMGVNTSPYDVNTFGVRYLGNKDERLLWDFEGMEGGKQWKRSSSSMSSSVSSTC